MIRKTCSRGPFHPRTGLFDISYFGFSCSFRGSAGEMGKILRDSDSVTVLLLLLSCFSRYSSGESMAMFTGGAADTVKGLLLALASSC